MNCQKTNQLQFCWSLLWLHLDIHNDDSDDGHDDDDDGGGVGGDDDDEGLGLSSSLRS